MSDVTVSSGRLRILRTGQQGCLLEAGGQKIGIDLYLSDSPRRLLPNMVQPEDLADVLLLFGTHNHLDHIDKPAWSQIAALNPRIRFVVPAFCRESIPRDCQIDPGRFIFVDEQEPADYQGIRIDAIAASHEFLDTDPQTGRHPHLCYLIRWQGWQIFHAGDTCRYDGFAAKINSFGSPDIAFLPINGRDAVRYASGCIGNLTYQEAVDLAGDIRPRLTIPGHYDMFAHNGEDPQRFGQYMTVKYPDLAWRILPVGETMDYPANITNKEKVK